MCHSSSLIVIGSVLLLQGEVAIPLASQFSMVPLVAAAIVLFKTQRTSKQAPMHQPTG